MLSIVSSMKSSLTTHAKGSKVENYFPLTHFSLFLLYNFVIYYKKQWHTQLGACKKYGYINPHG